jgi:hypothetical protein
VRSQPGGELLKEFSTQNRETLCRGYRYLYSGNNPVMLFDRNGRQCECVQYKCWWWGFPDLYLCYSIVWCKVCDVGVPAVSNIDFYRLQYDGFNINISCRYFYDYVRDRSSPRPTGA